MIEFLVQTTVSTIAAYLCVVATQPKFERIKSYNSRIEKMLALLDNVERLTIQYWTTDGSNAALEAEIFSVRTELSRLLRLLAKTGVNSLDANSVRQQMKIYFQNVTGGSFQQVMRVASPSVLTAANAQLSLIRDSLDKGGLSYSFKTIFFTRIP